MNRRLVCQLAFLPLILPLAGCGRSEESYEPGFVNPRSRATRHRLSFAVHPLHNPVMLDRIFRPLTDYLTATVGARFKLVSSRDYASFDRRLAEGAFDFALPNPYQVVRSAGHGYRVFGKVAGDQDFHGLILTRRDSPIRSIGQLRGKTIGYPAPTAVAATMLPQRFLHDNGVPLSSTRTVYVGSMESAIRSLIAGACDAAAIWPDPWQKFRRSDPEGARLLEVRWRTPHLVNNGLVVGRSVPQEKTGQVLAALTELSRSARGQALLDSMSIRAFEPADDRTYAPVRQFLREFSRTVRPIDLPDGVA